MGWQYDYKINDSRGASSGTAVLDVFKMFRIVPERTAGLRGSNATIPFRHGEVGDVMKWSPGFEIRTEGDLRFTDSAGAVTDPNLGPGHVHENLLLWRQLVIGGTTQLWFGRDDPSAGRVEVPFEVLFVPPISTDPRRRINTLLRTRWPFWSEETQRTAIAVASFVLAGTAPVGDAVFKIVGGTNVKVTHNQTGDFIQIEGATPAGGILVDCGLRKSTNVTGGASAEFQVEKSVPYWIQMEPGTVTFTVTGGGTVTVDLYEQYR